MTRPTVGIVGAGPAGLTAAHYLGRAGHDVTVFESEPTAGGRTHTEHFGAGHWLDTGAGWLADFYPDTLKLLGELGLLSMVTPMSLRGGGDLQIDGQRVPTPNSMRRLLTTKLVGVGGKLRFLAYMARLLAGQPGGLRIDMRYDDVPALDELRSIGTAARDRIVRPNFEGPFFARLDQMSAALVRSWLRCLSVNTFLHVDGGMDRPWRAVADGLDLRSSETVSRVALSRDGRVGIETTSARYSFDAAVVAVPAPVAASIVAPAHRPAVLDQVQYVPHVRLYAARHQPGGERVGVHIFPNDLVATVEQGDGRHGAWGEVPAGWEWALVCAPAASSGSLTEVSEQDATQALWSAAIAVHGDLFPLADADIVHLVRWRHAVPDVGVGYHARLATLAQGPPLVFAGDWLTQPCVEGAVRSGIEAARLLGAAVKPTATRISGRRSRRW